MSTPHEAEFFAGLDDFYLANPQRELSQHCDYGSDWRHGGKPWPRWRVSYIRDTSEVYAVCQHPQAPYPVLLLGVVPVDWHSLTDEAPPGKPHPWHQPWHATLDVVLDGWGHAQALEWVIARLAAWRAAQAREEQ